MSAEVVVTLAVGLPSTVAAVAAYLLSRSDSQSAKLRQLVNDVICGDAQTTRFRQLVADLLAPVVERVADVEEDVKELKQGGR